MTLAAWVTPAADLDGCLANQQMGDPLPQILPGPADQMTRSLPYIRSDEADRKIRGLEDDLFFARDALIRLMSPEAQEILTSHYQCRTKEESWRWPDLAAEKVVALCGEQDEETYCQQRAWCPLCGEGGSAPGQEGFTIPIGLQRHLLGSHNARQCSVFGAAHALARDRFQRDFPWP